MLDNAAKVSYAKSVLLEKYSGDVLTSGALVAGTIYRVTKFVSGDDFRNVGGCNRKGEVFEATATPPTVWTNKSKLREFKRADLVKYSLEVFAAATKSITVTRTGFEGGDASGEITFEKAVLGIAIEQLLAQTDPDNPSPASAGCGFVMQFGP